ncbi:unnamed protein product [Penicillium camemberti]|uniref:Str. FM013 n=1 Tax=Penicillium camemberti (strain FM 013) TaxID=1429867 RepID=A0A0G4NUW5_PENC3|nr:unnamed protein product [Penicillium camemberti]
MYIVAVAYELLIGYPSMPPEQSTEQSHPPYRGIVARTRLMQRFAPIT